MKQNIIRLKLYLVGLAVAFFIFGWALIAREAAVKVAVQRSTPFRTDTAESALTALPDLLPIPTLPPIRTRTS